MKRVIFRSSQYLLVLIVFGSTIRGQTPDDLVAQGDALLQARFVNAAGEKYGDAIEQDPDHPDAHFMRALTTLMNAYEQPSNELASVLTAWGVTYTRDLYALTQRGTIPGGESFTDTDNDGEYDDVEHFADGNNNGHWDALLIPATATTENAAIDALKSDLDGAINDALTDLEAITDNSTVWSRRIPGRTLPTQSPDGEDTIDLTDVYFLQAGLHLVQFAAEFMGGYDWDIDHARYNANPAAKIDEARLAAEPDFFTVRNGSSFNDAKTSLHDGLTALQTGLERICDAPYGNGAVMRSGYIAESDDTNSANSYSATDVLPIIAEVLAALDTTRHTIDFEKFGEQGEDPLLVELGRLFSHPIDRSDLDAYNLDTHSVDWQAADPTVNGLFPELSTGDVQAALFKIDYPADLQVFSVIDPDTVSYNNKNVHATYQHGGGPVIEKTVTHDTLIWGFEDIQYNWSHIDGADVRIYLPDFNFDNIIDHVEIFGGSDRSLDNSGTPLVTIDPSVFGFDPTLMWCWTNTGVPHRYYRVYIYFDANSSVATNAIAVDNDLDAIGDWWEIAHFGTLQEPYDSDNDGRMERREYLDGTDPNHPAPAIINEHLMVLDEGFEDGDLSAFTISNAGIFPRINSQISHTGNSSLQLSDGGADFGQGNMATIKRSFTLPPTIRFADLHFYYKVDDHVDSDYEWGRVLVNGKVFGTLEPRHQYHYYGGEWFHFAAYLDEFPGKTIEIEIAVSSAREDRNVNFYIDDMSLAIGVERFLADINSDGVVDVTDRLEIIEHFGGRQSGTFYEEQLYADDPAADVNRDGVVDIRDLVIVMQAFVVP
jgi:hypothetical protein